jgi:hypothetical protein
MHAERRSSSKGGRGSSLLSGALVVGAATLFVVPDGGLAGGLSSFS